MNIEKDNVKLLGEDKMVQYYWGWLSNALAKDKPWELHSINSSTNNVHKDMKMLYPPENPTLSKANDKKIIVKLAIRLLIPISLLLLIL